MSSETESNIIKLESPEEISTCDVIRRVKHYESGNELSEFVEFDVKGTGLLTIHKEDLINILNEFNNLKEIN